MKIAKTWIFYTYPLWNKIFHRYEIILEKYPLFPSTIMQISRAFYDKIVDLHNPKIKIIFEIWEVSLFCFIEP